MENILFSVSIISFDIMLMPNLILAYLENILITRVNKSNAFSNIKLYMKYRLLTKVMFSLYKI